MAITFPRDLVELASTPPFVSVRFALSYMQVRAPTRGGRQQAVNIGPDLWTANYVTRPLTFNEAFEVEAWLATLRGGAKTFKAWHPLRRYPQSYPNGWTGLTRHAGGSFDGTATLSTINSARDTITLTTLPSTFALKVGDMVSFPMGSLQSLHRVVDDKTASAGSAAVLVEPTVPLAATTGVAATLEKPWCEAVIDPASIQTQQDASRRNVISFSAVQTF